MNIWACDYKAIYFSFNFDNFFTCSIVLEGRYGSRDSGGARISIGGRNIPKGTLSFHAVLHLSKEVVL